MNMKRVRNLFLMVFLLFCLFTGCAGTEENNSVEVSVTDGGNDTTEAETENEANDTNKNEVNENETELESVKEPDVVNTSTEFVRSLKLGWNLGNTLDAIGKGMGSETSWGQPKTTKELIDYIKELGFTTIRIPVSWGNHVDADYNIDEQWMERVNEVVDYAIDNGLYVIINSHHDCDYYYPSEEKMEQSAKYIKAIWGQIAERFCDYDDHLIYESMNEPRLMGTNIEWWFADNDQKGIASIKCIVELNQIFVDTVRATGGNNATRYLMVPSNAAAVNHALNSAFTMPSDPAGRLILSVHAYTPYDFTMNANGYSEWNSTREGEFNFMNQLDKKFIQNGYGVVIGEFGATNKDNLEDRIEWADGYTKLAAEKGISCILWDNGGTNVGSENFGMINRRELKVYFPDILDTMMKNYSE